MFHAAVLSVVLIVAVGPNASLLCRPWCVPHAATASGRHHEAPPISPSVAGDDRCNDGVPSVAVIFREHVRRGVSASDVDHAMVVPRFQIAPSTTAARSGQEPGREWSLEKRPLATALRI